MKNSRKVYLVLTSMVLAFCLSGYVATCDEENLPPVLDEVEEIYHTSGHTLTINLAAADPNGDDLTFYAADLPEDAAFDTASGIFQWTPDNWTIVYHEVLFGVSDGEFNDEIIAKIHVNPDVDFASIEIEFDVYDVGVGEYAYAIVNGIKANGDVVEDIYVNWQALNEDIATIGFDGTITGVSPGAGQIRCWLVHENELFDVADVNVN